MMSNQIESQLNALKQSPSSPQALQSLSSALSDLPRITPEVQDALEQSRAALSALEQWEGVVFLIDLELERVDEDERRGQLLEAKARVLEDELLDEEQAIVAYEQALELRPDDAQLGDTLEHIKLVRGNWAQIAQRYVEEAEAATDKQLTTSMLLKAAEVIWRNQPDSELIEKYLQRSLETEPKNRKVSGHLQRLFRRQGRLAELALLLDRRLAAAVSREDRLAVLLLLGALCQQNAESADERAREEAIGQAVEHYRRALALDPSDPQALAFLKTELTKRQDWAALARLYEDAVRAEPASGWSVERLLELAQLYEERLDQPDEAEEQYRRLRKLAPASPAVLDFYRRRYEASGERAKLLPVLEVAQRAELDPDRRRALAREMAEIAQNDARQLDKAIDVWKAVLRMDQAQGEESSSPGDSDGIQEAVSALKRLYRLTTPPKWNALRELIREQIDSLPPDRIDEKVGLLLETIEIYRDHLKLDVMVVNTYNLILALKPDHRQSIEALAEHYEALGRWADLIEVLARSEQLEQQPGKKIDLLRRIATLWLEKGNQSRAIGPLERILQLAPDDEEALGQLEQLHEKRRNWRALFDLEQHKADHARGAERVEILERMAALATGRLGDMNEALRLWKEVLQEAPESLAALAALATLYTRLERWEDLALVLRQQQQSEGEPERGLQRLQELADLYNNRLGQVERAIDIWREVLEQRPDHPKALVMLRELLVRQEQWEELEELLGGRGDHVILADALTTAADRSRDDAVKVRLYKRVSEICTSKLDSPERAIKSYERVLAVDPDNLDTLRALVPLYRATERWSRLLATYEGLIRQSEEQDEKLDCMAQIRQLCEVHLGSRHMAFQWCAEAFELSPDQETVQELERLALAAGAWEDLIAVYGRRVSASADPQEKLRLLRRIAQICADQLQRPEQAEETHRAVLELAPSDPDALEALTQIHAVSRSWPALADVYLRRAGRPEASAAETTALLFECAAVQEERMADLDAAAATYERIAAQEGPDGARAVSALARLHAARSDWPALAATLERQLKVLADDSERVETLERLAEVLGDEIGRPDRAVAALAQALEIDPSHLPTRRLLEHYLRSDGPQRVQAARLLRPLYEQAGEESQLAQALEVLLEGGDSAPGEHEVMLARLVALYEGPLQQPDRALQRAASLLETDPTDAETVRRVVALSERCDGHEQATAALAGALERVREPEHELLLRWELASLLDDHPDRASEAETHLRRVLELQPQRADAWRRLERVLRDDGRWSELRELLQERLKQLEEPEQRRPVLTQICALSEDVLEDVPAAIAAYEQILELFGDDAEASRALERLYRGTEQWERLAALYQRQLGFVPDEQERWQLLVKQARVRGLKLDEVEQAVDLLAEVVQVAPQHDKAVSLLETLLAQGLEQARILPLLEEVFTKQQGWSRLVELLRMRVAEETSEEGKREVYLRLAEIHQDKLEDRLAAFNSLGQAIALAPGDEEVGAKLDALIDQLHLWQEGVQVWRDALERVDRAEQQLRIRILLRIAGLQLNRLDQPSAAAESYEEVLAAGLPGPEIARQVTATLVDIYDEAQRWSDLVHVLRARLPWIEDSEQIQAVHARIGQIQEELLEQPEEAVGSYRALLAEDPASTRALAALERIFLRGERWAELVDVLVAQVQLAEDPEARRQLWRRVAELQESALDDREQTIAAHLAILEDFPQQKESLRALSRICRALERWPELLQSLERQLALCEAETEERLELLFQAADVQHRRLADKTAAIERYRAVLAQSPQHLEARQALEELLQEDEHCLPAAELLAQRYQEDADWGALVRVSERQAERATGARRVDLLRTIAQLHEQNTGDLPAALDAHRRGLAAAVAVGGVVEQLSEVARVAELTDGWAQLVDAIESVLPDLSDEDDELVLRQRAGDICREPLRQVDRAVGHYKRVVEIEPDCMPVLEALQLLHEKTESWLPALAVMLRRVELVESPDEQVDLLLQAAVICRDRLDRLVDAMEQLERVLEIDRTHDEAIRLLDELYVRTGRWNDLCELLRAQTGRVEDTPERVALHQRIARIKADQLSDAAGAVEAWREVIKTDPRHEVARAALESYLEAPDLKEPVMRVLEPLYVAQQDWGKVVALYELRLGATDDPEQRLSLSRRIAQLCEEQLEDLDRALQWYGRVFEDAPTDVRIREQVLRLGGILDRWDYVAELFERYLAAAAGDSETVRDISLSLGRIYGDRLYRWQPARSCFERILDRRPDDLDAFEALERLLIRYERWQELLACYERAVERALEASERRVLLRKTARVWEEELEDLAQAIEVYRALLGETEDDPEVVGALDRLYHQSGRWEELCELLGRQLGTTAEGEQHVALKFRLGQIYEQRLGDGPSAIDFYEEVLREQPEHAEAVAALERLVLDRSQRFRITQILAPIYQARDDWAKLVVVYEAELDFVDDAERRVHLLREIARLYEQRGSAWDLAFKALARAFGDEQRREVSEEILTDVERLAEQLGNWPEVGELIGRAVETAYDPDYRNALLARLAGLQEERMADPAAAVGTWSRLLSLREHDAEAVTQLLRLLEQQGRFEQLVEVLHRKAESSDDVATKCDCYRRIAVLSEEQLTDTDAATDAWRQVLSLDEHHEEALDRLATLLERAEDWQELVWAYQQKVAAAEEDQSRWRELQLAMARVYEEKLGGTFEAIAVLKGVLERIPDDGEAYDALDRLYSREGLWSDLLDIVELKGAHEQDGAARNELLFRAGTILTDEIADLDAAVDRFEQVVTTDSGHQGARAALEQLAADPGRRARVAAVLEQIYEQVGDPAALVKVLEASLDGISEPQEGRALLVRIAALQEDEDQLDDPAAAFDAYARALKYDPSNEAVQAHVARLAEKLGCWPETLELYEGCLGEVAEAAGRRSLHLKLASLYEAPVGGESFGRAEEHYRAAMDLEGDDVETLKALEQLLERQHKRDELLEVLERMQVLAVTPAEQAQLSWRMGEILRSSGQEEAAFAAYRDALERDASDQRARQAMIGFVEQEAYRAMALDVLEPICERGAEFEALVQLQELRLSTLVAPDDRVVLLGQMARLLEEELGQPGKALETLGRALQEDGERAEALEQLEQLAERTGSYEPLCQIAEETLARDDVPDEFRRDLSLSLAGWCGDELGDAKRAEMRYRKLLEEIPDCAPAWEALERISRAEGDLPSLVDAVKRRAELAEDAEQQMELWTSVAQLRAAELDQPEGAIDAWQEVLQLDPEHLAALSALAPLYERLGRSREQVEVLLRRAQLADSSSTEAELKYHAGELLLDRLGEAERAADVFREALDLEPGDQRTLLALVRLHQGQGDWSTVRELLVQQLERASGTDAVALYRELARISAEELDEQEEAMSYYQQILLVAPADEDAYARLARLQRAQGKWHDLIDLKRQRVSRLIEIGETDGAVQALLDMAKIWSDELSDPHAAAQLVEESLQKAPDNVSAIADLARLYQSIEQWEQSLDAIARAEALGPSDKQLAELRYRRGSVLLSRGAGPEEALALFEGALALDGGHLAAAVAIEDVARSQQRWDTVAKMLELRSGLAPTEARLPLLTDLAQLYRQKLDQLEASAAAWERALAASPDDPELAYCLADAYCEAGRLDEAEPLARQLIDQSAGRRGKALAAYHHLLGAIAEKRGGDLAEALRSFERAHQADSTRGPTLVALGRLFMQLEKWESARKIYRSMLLQNPQDDWGITRAEIFCQIGLVHKALGEPAKARSMFERGLEAEPDSERLKVELADLAES